MKGHKEYHHRKGRSTGGVNEAAEDLKDKPEARTNAANIDREAEERKRGGRAKRKDGGKAEGEMMKMRADRKPRKSGGRTGADKNPFSSARHGSEPKGHKTDGEVE